MEEKRISEAPAPNAQDASDYRPLYERLQELKDKKDSDWKEKHNPFGRRQHAYLLCYPCIYWYQCGAHCHLV